MNVRRHVALAALLAGSTAALGCAAEEARNDPPPVADEALPGATGSEEPSRAAQAPAGATEGTKTEAPSAPAATPAVLRSGTFVDKDYKGSGTASIVRPAGETTSYLRLEGFSTSAGPALHVLLTRDASPSNKADVDRGSVDLGALRALSGNLTYPLPAGLEIEDYAGVIVYCVDYSVVFTAASLSAP